jgi:hypothetical protein
LSWVVEFDDAFEREFDLLDEKVRLKALAIFGLIEEFGPSLGRPKVDTLYDSAFTNMKELRFSVGREEWRIAFAFDSEQKGILLIAGDKAGKNEKRFYKHLIATADQRFAAHLDKTYTERKKD